LAPQNLEAERALLGGMLLDNRKIADIMESVPRQAMNFHYFREGRAVARSTAPEAEPLFSHGANQEIFEVIADLYDRERQVDLTTLAEELHRAGRFEAIGGAGYLAGLEEDLLSTLYLPEYLRIVVEKWRLRSLMRAGESIVRDVLRGEQDVLEVLDRSERRIFDLSQQVQSQDFVHVGEIAAHAMAEIEARSKQDDSVTGLPTGFRELDRMTTGLRPSNLIIIAARPSVGKSAFAMNIAARAAVKHNRPVGVFSLEMSAMELNQRLLCTLAGVPLGKLRANRLGRQDMDRLHAQTIRLDKAPLYIDDSSGLSILELRSRSRRLKSRCPNLGLIVVDYLQLMHAGGGRVENRQQEVSLISRALKALSRDLEVPVIALSQLSRASEQRGGRTTRDRMPKLSDLRESGAIEQDADVVVFIHRDFKSKADDDPRQGSEPDLATVRLAKQRNGPVGDFQLLFRGEVTEFVDIHPEAMGAGRR
jgi:replicative DNA helicase